MSSLSISNIGGTSFDWQITGLSNLWDSSSYSEADIGPSAVTDGQSTAPSTWSSCYPPTPPGSGYDTPVTSASGFSTGTTYTVYAFVKAANGLWYNAGSSTITTLSPPSGIPSVSATAQSGHQIAVSWSSVSGATNYDVYADGVLKGSTSGTSLTISIDKEYYTYTIYVTPTNSAGTGNSGSTTVTTLDETDPTCSAFSVGTIAQTTVSVSASGYDNSPTAGNASGLSGFYFYLNGSYVGSAYQSSGSASYTFTGLTAGTTYTLGCRAFDNAGNVSTMATQSVTTTNRPANFAWQYSKDVGSQIITSVAEWTDLQNKINQFRQYKGLGNYAFTAVTTSTIVNNPSTWNPILSAIQEMNPPTALPATSTAVGTSALTSSFYNGVLDSLNSIP